MPSMRTGARAPVSGMDVGGVHMKTSFCSALVIAATMLVAPSTWAQDGAHISYARIPSDAFSVIAEVRAKPGKEEELRAAALPLIKLVRGDPKNLVYFLQQ